MAVWCVWLAVFVVCIGLEAASMALTSIWFAGGALIACVLSIAGVNLYIQMAVFVVVSFLLLYSTRPLALRYINQKTVRTNVDALVGKKARVTAEIDNDEARGTQYGQSVRPYQTVLSDNRPPRPVSPAL